MSRVSPLDENEGSGRTQLQQKGLTQAGEAIEPLDPLTASEVASASDPNAVLTRLSQLPSRTKVALVRQLITQLETNHVQAILEFGLQEIADRDRHSVDPTVNHNTRLLLKKDYSYQERGLEEPTQYYVYLRRRKPKLDRYIGALFYVSTGCTLSYFLDAAERITFNPPHNIFQLQDSTDAGAIRLVRLICLEPPAAAYTFSKQQEDTPEIRLHLEYLHPQTHQPLSRHAYPFPACMYEGGALDRYRWEVSTVTIASEVATLPEPVLVESPPASAAPLTRRVLELPATPLTFQLVNSSDTGTVLKRLRLWVTWSEKAMPQSRWEAVQEGSVYMLMNAHFKRRILRFSLEDGSIALENSLPVLVKWFHDLSLAVSQTQNQRQYSAAQLKLAHNLFVETSLPQKEPLILLKKLFGVEFARC